MNFVHSTFLEQIKFRKLTTRQKVLAYNKLALPAISFPMSVAEIPRETTEKLDEITANFFKRQQGLIPQLGVYKVLDPRTWGIKSLEDSRKAILISTMMNQSLQTQSIVVRRAVEYRIRSGDHQSKR